MGRAWAAAGFAVFALAGCGGEAPEGDSESARSTTTEAAAIQTLPWPAPSMTDLLGKWSQEGRRVVAWFKPDGVFVIGNLENPFANGTFKLQGSTLTFASDLKSGCTGSTFVWEVGLDQSGSEDRLQALVTRGACGAVAGEQWTFARIG
jgi:hypothetical protein